MALLFDEASPRNPFKSQSPYEPGERLAGLPVERQGLADKAAAYLLQDYQGKRVPIFTAGFWDAKGKIGASESWKDVLIHGGHLLRRQLMPTEAALRQWNEDYEMSAAQEKLTRELFKRKQMEPAKKTPITEAEWKTVLQEGKDGGGSEESRQSLTEAGFIVP